MYKNDHIIKELKRSKTISGFTSDYFMMAPKTILKSSQLRCQNPPTKTQTLKIPKRNQSLVVIPTHVPEKIYSWEI